MSFDLWWMPTLSFQWTSFIIMYSYSRKSHIFISTSKLKVWPGIFVKLSECSQDVSLCFHNSFCSFLPKMLFIPLAPDVFSFAVFSRNYISKWTSLCDKASSLFHILPLPCFETEHTCSYSVVRGCWQHKKFSTKIIK